jgi:hypothetical protein
MLMLSLNPIEPPWYGPVCQVVWEGRRREAPPYPDVRQAWRVAPKTGAGNREAKADREVT